MSAPPKPRAEDSQRTISVQSQPLPTQISIIIPAFNEEAGIGPTLESLLVEESLRNAEIIVVDDGSQDQTAAVVNRYERVRIIQHPFNRGYGSAIHTGVRASTGEYIFWFDSDGQHQAPDLVKVMRKLIDENLEYCIGVREAGSYEDGSRKLGKWLLKTTLNFSMGRSLPDFNSGLRGFKRDVLLRYMHLLPKGFGASTLTTLLMMEGNHYGSTVPIRVRARVGKSTVKQLRDGIRTIQIMLHIIILFSPLRFFGAIGLFLILLGTLYGVIKASINHLGFPVFALLMIMLGMQSFLLGFIGDQISAMRRERLG